MAKIIKENNQVLPRSSYQALIQDEWEQKECKNECSLFMESLHKVMGHCAMSRDLVDLGVEKNPSSIHRRTNKKCKDVPHVG